MKKIPPELLNITSPSLPLLDSKHTIVTKSKDNQKIILVPSIQLHIIFPIHLKPKCKSLE